MGIERGRESRTNLGTTGSPHTPRHARHTPRPVNMSLVRTATDKGATVSMMTMAGATLGSAGSAATAAAYVFLHYALLVACEWTAGVGQYGWPLVDPAWLLTERRPL